MASYDLKCRSCGDEFEVLLDQFTNGGNRDVGLLAKLKLDLCPNLASLALGVDCFAVALVVDLDDHSPPAVGQL